MLTFIANLDEIVGFGRCKIDDVRSAEGLIDYSNRDE